MSKKTLNIILFLTGLLANYRIHVIGMIGISELLMLLAAPVVFMMKYHEIRRHGFAPLCWLLLLTCAGCVVASIANDTSFADAIRGFATPLVFFASVVCVYALLRRNLNGLKWLMLGLILSSIVSFFLQSGGEAAELFSDDAQFGINSADVMRMYIVLPVFLIPVYCYYDKLPWAASAAICFLLGIYTIMASASGRSTALIILAGGVLICLGQKSIKQIEKIKKHFVVFLIACVFLGFMAKVAYSNAAKSGMLGEDARLKYEIQTGGHEGVVQLFVGGRANALSGLYAACFKPIVGYGPWAIDWDHLNERFLDIAGTAEDYAARHEARFRRLARGEGERYECIGWHSYVAQFWVWYGIFGLILWLYVLWVIIEYFRKYVDVVPQWFGLLSLLIPRLMWNMFFSPFGSRVLVATTICTVLFARAVANRKIRLDATMEGDRLKFLPRVPIRFDSRI